MATQNMAQQFGNLMWQEMTGPGDPNAMKNHFVEDPVQIALHRHPELIKILFDKAEIHTRRNWARYRVLSGLHHKDMLELEMMKDTCKEGIKKTLFDEAMKGMERELEQAQLTKDENGNYTMTLPISELKTQEGNPVLDLSSEHFFTILLASFHQVHQQNSQVYLDFNKGHYAPNPNDPNNPYYMSPKGVHAPQYNPQNQFTGYQHHPGNYYGQQGFPPQPHSALGPQHHPSSGMAGALGLLSNLML